MKPFHVAWTLLIAVAPVTAVFSNMPTGPPSPEKLAMERNGKLKGPKAFVPNPGFELSMGKPWKLVGSGVEVVDDVSLSRRGRNSLLFTVNNTVQRPEVYSVHLKSLKPNQVYYLTFHYRILELNEVAKEDECFITLTLGNMVVGYPIFVKMEEDLRLIRHDHVRYKKVAVPMYSTIGVSPLIISALCNKGIGIGDAVRVSIDDIRLEKGEGLWHEWAFYWNRPEYQYWQRDQYIRDYLAEGANYYSWSHQKGMPVKCRLALPYTEDPKECAFMGSDYRRQDLWDEGLGDYWPREDQLSREVSEVA